MKKTKLFTSIVALALVLGLGACEGDVIINVGDVDSSDSTDTSETTGDTTPSESTPEGGNEGGEETYLFGFELDGVLNAIDGGYVLDTDGNPYVYELTYTSSLDDALKFTYEAGEAVGEYYISTEIEGVQTWVAIVTTSDNHTNVNYVTDKTPLYWNPTYECWGNETQTYFLCQNATFKCFYCSSIVSWIDSSPIAALYNIDGSKVTGFVGEVYQEPGLGYDIPEPNIGVDTTYRLGALVDETTYRFFNGTTTGSTFLGTTLDWDEAAEVYITAIPDDGVTNSCTLSIVVDEELKYISNNNSTSITLTDDPCIWVWVESLEVFAQGSEEGRVLVYYTSGQDFRGYAQSETNLAYPHVHAYEQAPEGYEPPSEYDIPEPNVGTDSTYKLGALDASAYKYVYLDGGTSTSNNSTFLTTTETFDDAASFYITSVPGYSESNAVTLSYFDSQASSLKYLSSGNSNTTLTYEDDPCVWIWVAETDGVGYFAVETASTGRFIGLNTSYETAGGYAHSNLSSYPHFVAYSQAQTNPEVPEVTTTFEQVTSLVDGQQYYLGSYSNNIVHFITGATSSYQLATTTDLTQAAAVTATGNDTDGWKLTLPNGNYIYMFLYNSSNLEFGTSSNATVPSSGVNVFSWSSNSATLYTSVIKGTYYGTTYNYSYFEYYNNQVQAYGANSLTFSNAAHFYQQVTD